MKRHGYIQASVAVLASALFFCGSVHGELLYDTLSGSSGGSFGYLNKTSTFGESVSLDQAATLNSLTYKISNVYSTYNSGTLTVSFFNIDAGTDGLMHTADDRVGGLIDSYTSPTLTVSSGQNVTVSGFSIGVPQDFIFTVQNGAESGSGFSYTIEKTSDSAAIGTDYTEGFYNNWNGAVTEGQSIAYSYDNSKVQLGGVAAIPEPATLSYMGLSMVGVLLARRRR